MACSSTNEVSTGTKRRRIEEISFFDNGEVSLHVIEDTTKCPRVVEVIDLVGNTSDNCPPQEKSGPTSKRLKIEYVNLSDDEVIDHEYRPNATRHNPSTKRKVIEVIECLEDEADICVNTSNNGLSIEIIDLTGHDCDMRPNPTFQGRSFVEDMNVVDDLVVSESDSNDTFTNGITNNAADDCVDNRRSSVTRTAPIHHPQIQINDTSNGLVPRNGFKVEEDPSTPEFVPPSTRESQWNMALLDDTERTSILDSLPNVAGQDRSIVVQISKPEWLPKRVRPCQQTYFILLSSLTAIGGGGKPNAEYKPAYEQVRESVSRPMDTIRASCSRSNEENMAVGTPSNEENGVSGSCSNLENRASSSGSYKDNRASSSGSYKDNRASSSGSYKDNRAWGSSGARSNNQQAATRSKFNGQSQSNKARRRFFKYVPYPQPIPNEYNTKCGIWFQMNNWHTKPNELFHVTYDPYKKEYNRNMRVYRNQQPSVKQEA